MNRAVKHTEADPLRSCLLLTLAFAALVWWRLGIPAKLYFDEVHYVPAARKLIDLLPANLEHPMFGKEAIAGSLLLFGDHPWAWRLPSAIMGPVGLFAFARALWLVSGRRFATLAGMVLLATDFTWLIHSRIAMLDMVMAGFGMVALWQIAAAACAPQGAPAWRVRAHLALAGVSMGLAMAAKWSIIPMLVLICAVLVCTRLFAGGRHYPSGRQGPGSTGAPPARGVNLIELLFWLGLLPLLVYGLTFLPACWFRQDPLHPLAIVTWHRTMMLLQDSVVKHHPYQSVWWQWMIDWRPIWYLYENVDGGQRGVLLLGNPFSMIAGLLALPWCLWAGLRHHRWEALLIAGCYVISIGMWPLSGKPVQFYYHYLLPGALLMAALALALDALWHSERWWRWAAPVALGTSIGLFIWFFPIIAALKLSHGAMSFETWMWLNSWR